MTDALDDPDHVVPITPPPGRHRREEGATWAEARGWHHLAVGETCTDCASTALVDHWHTATDCAVARTGWGGP